MTDKHASAEVGLVTGKHSDGAPISIVLVISFKHVRGLHLPVYNNYSWCSAPVTTTSLAWTNTPVPLYLASYQRIIFRFQAQERFPMDHDLRRHRLLLDRHFRT